MIINGSDLLDISPIVSMETDKVYHYGVSHGLGEAGYDIRIKQRVVFSPDENTVQVWQDGRLASKGRFVLASAIEEFQMPDNLVGVVHDKSTWARKGLSVFNTVIEPGWNGFLTLELVYHGNGDLVIAAGSGIAQVLFSEVSNPSVYTGRYQNQADKPVKAKEAP